ncbi:MAG TPA: hypothetical protein PKA90_16120 [Ignavibacteria bacterium]|nr:hypothetical protein [Ignavibacteria bacterium]HMR41944.1 hypothetical protein [Ignavibacteria bacterium]
MKITLALAAMILFTSVVKAQNSEKTFDFWLGKWDAYWNDSLNGSNSINKILDDKIIQENFSTMDNSFTGKSWTVYDSVGRIWKQTWVDNNGAYIVLTGGQEIDGVALYTEEKTKKTGEIYYMRMIFQNIEKDGFDWNWQSSSDKIIWKTEWAIKYKRAEN